MNVCIYLYVFVCMNDFLYVCFYVNVCYDETYVGEFCVLSDVSFFVLMLVLR